MKKIKQSIKHSENKVITLSGVFENEIGPGVLQSSILKSCMLWECQSQKAWATYYASILSFLSGTMAGSMFFESSTRTLQVHPRFQNM